MAREGAALRLRAIIRLIENHIGSLVHRRIRPDVDMFVLHQRLITLRIASGAIVLATLPAVLLMTGGINALGMCVLLGLTMPLLSALILTRTGDLAMSQIVASLGFVTAITGLALLTGGLDSPLLMLLIFVPFEAQVSRHRVAALVAGLISFMGLGVFWVQGWSWTTGVAPSPEALLSATVVASALALSVITTLMVMGQRRRHSQERRQMLVRSRMMLESVGDMVAWFDASGHLAYVNASAYAILNAKPDSLLDRGLFSHVHVADRPLFLKTIDDVAHSGQSAIISIRALTGPDASGEQAAPLLRWLEMRVQRVTHAANGVRDVAVVAVLRDETERRQIELDRENARAEAQRANDLKGRFLATVSHELRTPLNAIIGFSEMLATEGLIKPDSPQQRDYAHIIRTSGLHLLEVVNALLDISKIESGAMTIDRDALDMTRLVSECCDLMTIRCAEKGITLERVIGADMPQVMADRRALKQVTINLLSNAVKFTPEGGTVTVALVRDKGEIDFSISDTGIGIAEADLPRLGVPFFQARSAYDRSHEGTGLGLSVVRGLVGLHGGSMSIESAPGEGTRVCIRLPIEADEAVQGENTRILTFAKSPRRQLGLAEPARKSA
jgi:two-component system, cell cycle sensor histidine kinase DivJ